MKVLVVGASGYVGGILRPALEQHHQCCYYDLRPVEDTDHEVIVGDVNDDEKAKAAVQGKDAVIYMPMGMDPATTAQDPTWDITAAFGVNITGWYRFACHGLKAGIRKFIYASSMSVYHGGVCHDYMDEDRPADAWDPYGVSKSMAETVCHRAALAYPDATFIALRMIHPRSDADWQRRTAGACHINPFEQGPDDLRRLYLASLQCETLGAHVLQTSGDVEGVKVPNHRATQVLGWAPQGA